MRSRSLTRRQVIASVGVSAAAAMQVQLTLADEASPVASPQVEDLQLVEVALLTGSDPAAINQTGREYGVDGADLGSTFLYNDQIYIVFGDSFDIGKSDWRSNLLAISSDDDPTNGITFDRMIEDRPGHAKELLSAKHVEGDEVTVIPTYGVAVGDRLFLHYMSVKHWGAPGHWDLGLAGFAYSDDDGETWTKDADAVLPGDTNWGQVAIVEHEDVLYLFGIPGGRYGDLKLARVSPAQLLQIDAWEYWNGTAWGVDIATAAVVVEGPIGELSVRWNSYYQRWLMMYLIDDRGLIVLRSAADLTGPWDKPRVVVRSTDYPALYAPYIYPKWNDGPEVYFNMSLFGPYNVSMMKTEVPDLAP
jgi:D-arabinan endo alpha-(1,5)-arabinofuranosidase